MLFKKRRDSSIATVIFGVLPTILAFSGSSATASTCESLTSLSQPNTTITSAQSVAAGAFEPPGPIEPSAAGASLYSKLRAFCRVAATLRPSSDSDIKIEVWLPVSAWNGKLQSVGNGGWAGFISYPALARGVAEGYATASTDTGHTGNTGSFALGHPEKMIDFGYRSEHEMTVTAKAIIAAFYGDGPRLSYWNGCSTGGRQGLTEAQRYPSDYNAIIAGAPANNRMHIYVWSLWIAQAVQRSASSYIPPSKYAVIHKAVVEACDALDGLKDGLINDPRRCHFDPKVLLCKGADGPSCLTSQQLEVARKIYSAVKNPRTGQEIYPGLQPGSELGWVSHAGPEPSSYATDGFKYVVFRNPDWDFRTLNLDSDVALADNVDNGTTSAMDPNLKEFFRQGGKLLMYHGWSDPQISPLNTINYYSSALKALGAAETADSIRLFMLPGMGHCEGGDGPNTFDAIGTLARWFEKGEAPNQIVASHSTNGAVDRTRPICAYPKVAAYVGSGSIDEAANFVCKAP